MASFDVTITALDASSVVLRGSFTGGDPDYQNYRRIALDFTHGGSTSQTTYIYSAESSGPDNTFFDILSGFDSGETYLWTAILQYYDASGWHYTAYRADGAVTIPLPATGVEAWIYDNGWHRARTWVYDGGWHRTQPWIHDSGWR